MARRLILLLGPALCVALGAARAQAADAKKPRIAVLEVRASGKVDAKAMSGLGAYIAAEMSKPPFRVSSAGDLTAALGFERQKQLLGCSDASCFVEMAGALGVEYLAVPEVSEIGGTWLLNVALLDSLRGQAVSRVTRRAAAQAGLVDAVPEAVAALMAPVREKLGLEPQVAPTPPKPVAEAAPVAEVKAQSSRRTVGYVLDAAAVLLLAGGAVCDGLAVADNDAAKAAAGRLDWDAYEAGVDGRRAKGTASLVLYGVGAAAAIAGLVLTFLPESSAPPVTTGISVAPGGASLVVSGGF